MKKLLSYSVVVILLFSASGQAQTNIGASGAQFLKIGVGSRYQGMSEAAVAQVNDVYSMYWNPAGLAAIENSSVSFTNVNWFLDINLNYFGYARNFENVGVFGVSVMVLSMDDQEITTFEDQDGTGQYFSTSSVAIGISYARQLTAQFAFGGTLKYVGENIYLESSNGVAVDFGTMLHTGFRSLRLGMSISNIGTTMRFSGPNLDVSYDDQDGQGSNTPIGASVKTNDYDLPLTFRMGLAYDFLLAPNSMLTFSAELKHPNDNEQQGSLGMEYGFNEQYFLRGGYKLNYQEETFALGGGIVTGVAGDTRIVLDYAWEDFGRLNSTQRFSIGFTF